MKKKKLSWQKIFNFVSLIFLLTCLCVYAGRYFYYKSLEESGGDTAINTKKIFNVARNNNLETEDLVTYSGEFYYHGNDANNYVTYANRTWRIIKFSREGNVRMVLDDVIGNLALGNVETSFLDSKIMTWLNKEENIEHSGKFESILTNKDTHLVKSDICLDSLDEIKKTNCVNINKDYYVTLPSVLDYLITGDKNSFINDNNFIYLEDMTSDLKAYILNNENAISTTDTSNIYGIKPVITLNSNVEVISGDGSKENPYIIEERTNEIAIGSHVKLGLDNYIVYDIDGDNVKLILDGYYYNLDEEVTYQYANSGTKFNPNTRNTLAYYLNNTFLNSLTYKNSLKECTWYNGVYGEDSDYEYNMIYESEVTAKVGLLNISDFTVISKDNYFTMTPASKNGSLLYANSEMSKVSKQSSSKELKIVPSICIDKNSLTKGIGSLNEPFEME